MVTVREPYELSIREASDLIKRVFLSGYRLWGHPSLRTSSLPWRGGGRMLSM